MPPSGAAGMVHLRPRADGPLWLGRIRGDVMSIARRPRGEFTSGSAVRKTSFARSRTLVDRRRRRLSDNAPMSALALVFGVLIAVVTAPTLAWASPSNGAIIEFSTGLSPQSTVGN